MTLGSNIWVGYSSVDFANVQERSEIQVSNVDHYLNNVEYIVDVHLTRSSLANMFNNVYITYASNNVTDFGETTSPGFSNAFTYQVGDGKSFDIRKGKEVIGRMPATLRGKYAENVNAGADRIKLKIGNYPLLSDGNELTSFLPLFYDETGKASVFNTVTTQMNQITDSVYNNHNIVMSAIPKAVSAQLQGFTGDENILRLIGTQNTYFNLLTYSLQGSLDNNSNKVDLASSLSGCDVLGETTYSVSELISGDETPDKNVDNVPIGHYILSHIFNKLPPVGDRVSNTSGTDALWEMIDIDDYNPEYDVIKLSNTSNIETTLNLQFILQTKMSLKSREGNIINATTKSPAHAADGEVQILFNFIFDREDPLYETVELIGSVGFGSSLELTAPFANYSTLTSSSTTTAIDQYDNPISVDVSMSVIGASTTSASTTTFLASTNNIAGEDTQPAVIDEYLAPLIELTPHGTTFNEPLTLDIAYSTAGLVEGQIVYILKMPDSGSGVWEEVARFPYDPTQVPIVTVELISFSVIVPSTIKLTGAPLAPSSVTNGAITHNSVALSWPRVTTKPIPTGYNIVANSPNPLLKNTSETNYIFTGLLANTEYSFSVSSFLTKPDGSILESSATNSATIITGPGVVSNLTFTNITHNSVFVSWDSADGANRYLLNSSGPIIGYYTNEPTKSQLVQGLIGNTEYTFSVKSLRTVPESSTISGATTSTVNITTLPGPVINITASDVDYKSITLSWDAPATGGVDTYRIVPTGGGLSNVDVPAPNTTYKFDMIPSNTLYDFTIISINSDGLVGGTDSLTGVITGPDAVINLTHTGGTTTTLSLEWIGSTGANLYSVTNGSDTQTTTSNNITFSGLSANTYYDITVTPYNDSTRGDSSILSDLITAPLAPSDPSVSGLTGSGLTLSWTGAGGATKYQIVADDSHNQTIYETDTTFYTFTGLQPATTYNFTITSYNGDNLVGESVTLENIFTSPSAVTDLINTGVTDTSISLTWTGAEGANKYYITNGSDTQTTTLNNITFTGLTGNTYYTMKVTSYIGDTVEGSNVSTDPILTAPVASVTTNSSGVTHDSITLSWAGADGASDYYISEPNLLSEPRILQGTSSIFNGLDPNTNYNFTITSYNGALVGGSVSTGNIRTAPAGVTDFTTSSVTPDSITLSWTGASGATDYYISEPNLLSEPRILQGTSSIFNGLDPNTNYNFTITSYNGTLAGESVSTSNIRTAPSSVTGLASSGVNHESLTLSWTGADGAAKYKIVPNIGSIVEVVGNTTHTFSGLDANTLYTFEVISINSDGVEGGSATLIGAPTYSYSSSTESGVTVRNGYLYDTTLNTYGAQVFSQLSDKPYIIEQASNTTDIHDSDYTTGSLIDMSIPSEITGSVSASYQDGFYIEFQVNNSSISHINPSKFRCKQVSHSTENPLNIMLIGKELPSSQWTYLKEKTNISDSVDWIDSDTISVSGKFSIFRMYLDASDIDGNRGTSLTDFDIICDGYLRSQDANKGVLTAPGVPSGVQYTDRDEDSITLQWNNVDGANAYSVTNGSSTKFVSNANLIIYDQLDGNTTYSFTVTSYNDTLVGGSSTITSITTAPDEPTGVLNPSVTDTTATLTWNAVDGASKYVVTNGSSTQNTNTNNITFTGLTENTTYNFTITSYNGDVLEGGSYLKSGILTTPASVTGVSSSGIDHDSITLSWTGASGATKYTISEPNLTTIDNVTGTTYTFNSLVPNTNYNFTITTYSGALVGGSVQTGDIITAPAAVINLRNTMAYSDKFYLLWNRPDGATSYSIRTISDTSDSTVIITSDIDQVAHVISGLTSYTEYTTIVTPINNNGNAGESATIITTTAANAYIDSSNVSITGTDTTLTVTWADSSSVLGLTGYDIITSMGTPRNLPADTTTYTWTGLNSLTLYTFRIVPVTITDTNRSTGDQYSGNYTTGPPAVSTLVSSSITETSLTLSWTGASGSTDYYISEPNLLSEPRVVQGTSNIFSDLTPNTTYNFTITSYNGASQGGASSTSVTTNPEVLARAATDVQVQENTGVSDITWNSINIGWTPGSDTSSYSLSVSPSVSGYPQTTSDTTNQFIGLTENTTYTFTITSLNNLGNAGESTTVSGTTAPGKVGTITVDAVAYNSVDLSWVDAAGANNYTANNGTTSQTTSSNTITFSGLTANTEYNFTVTSYRDLIEGLSKNINGITTGPEAATNFSVGEITQNTVPLTWTEEPAANNYSLQISDGLTTTAEVITGNNYTASNLETNTSYTFSLQSKGYSGRGPNTYYKYYAFTFNNTTTEQKFLSMNALFIYDEDGNELPYTTFRIGYWTAGQSKNGHVNTYLKFLGTQTSSLITTIQSPDGKLGIEFAAGAKPHRYVFVGNDLGGSAVAAEQPLSWVVSASNVRNELNLGGNANTLHTRNYDGYSAQSTSTNGHSVDWIPNNFLPSTDTGNVYANAAGNTISSSTGSDGFYPIYLSGRMYISEYLFMYIKVNHPWASGMYSQPENATLDDNSLFELGDLPTFVGELSGNTTTITTKTTSDVGSKIIFLDSHYESDPNSNVNQSSDLELGKRDYNPIETALGQEVALTFKIHEGMDLGDYNHAVIQFTSDVIETAASEVMAPVRLKIYESSNSLSFIKWDVYSVWERGLKKYNTIDIFPIIRNFTGTDLTLVIEGQTAEDNDDNQANEGRLVARSGSSGTSGIWTFNNRYEAPQLILHNSPIADVDFSALTAGTETIYTNDFQEGELTYSTPWPGSTTSYNSMQAINNQNSSDYELGYCHSSGGTTGSNDTQGPPLPTLITLNFGAIDISMAELSKLVFKQEDISTLHQWETPVFPVKLKIISAHGDPVDWEIPEATGVDNYETPDIKGLLNPSGTNEIQIRSANTDINVFSRITMDSGRDIVGNKPFIYAINLAHPVTDLRVTTYGGTSVKIKGTEGKGASSYSVQTSPESSDGIQTFTGPILVPVEITGLYIGTDYTFTVTSIGAAGTPGGVTTLVDNSGLGAVSNLVAIVLDFVSDKIQLEWDNSYQAGEYSIVTDPVTTTQTSLGSPYKFTGLNPNTPYTFYVTSKNGSYIGETASVTQTTGPIITSATASDITTDSITVTWPAAPGADQYSVAIRIFNSGADYIETFLSTSILTYTFTGLTSGTQYQIRISPYKNGTIGDPKWVTPTTLSTWVEIESSLNIRSGFARPDGTRVFIKTLKNTPQTIILSEQTVGNLDRIIDTTAGTGSYVEDSTDSWRRYDPPEIYGDYDTEHYDTAPSYGNNLDDSGKNKMWLERGFAFICEFTSGLTYTHIEPTAFKYMVNDESIAKIVRLYGFGKHSSGDTVEKWELIGTLQTTQTVDFTHILNINTTLKCSKFKVFLSRSGSTKSRVRINDFWIEGKGYNSA